MEPTQAYHRLPTRQEEARQEFRGAHQAGHGCGKSTQVSQFILFDEWKSGLLVACTQPRVIAATSVARHVARELDVDLGDEVGYAVRFDNTSNDRTRLKFLTDGLLLQELRYDREFSRYACVMAGEAHERTKNTGLLLALLKQAMGMRPDLKVVVMSATIDLTTFTRYFPGSNMFHVQGHAYPVQIQYLREATPDYQKAVLEAVAHVAHPKPEGSILVFMTSVPEIEETCRLIRKKMECVMDTKTRRKCIVSTNVDEDGLTIQWPQIRDRQGTTDCRPLANTPPGILKSEVMAEVLILKSYGFHKISDFNFVDGPHAETLLRALYEFRALGYIDADAKLTTKRSMVVARRTTSSYGADVIPQQYSDAKSFSVFFFFFLHLHAILSSILGSSLSPSSLLFFRIEIRFLYRCWNLVCAFHQPRSSAASSEANHWPRLNAFRMRMRDNEAVPALEPSDPDFDLKIRQSLAAGFYHKGAHLDRRGTYKTVHDNQPVAPEPDSCLVGEKKE
ncbi:Helicase C-terminal domain-containing protein [Fusarium sp. LHS14.1]|nr:Helicase C-terminal domain-containing protein [Fusarium sp. LHS14.1]